jgi:predicted transcriptional regulator
MPASNHSQKDTVLELSSRRRLFNLIQKCPGIHFREIQRRTGFATGALSRNLDELVQKKLLRKNRDGQYLRYYTLNAIEGEDKRLLELLRRKALRDFMIFLLENGTCNNKILSVTYGLSPSTVSMHLNKLSSEGILQTISSREGIFYSLRQPELVEKLLITYRESWLDEIVDKFMDGFRKTNF